MKIDLNRQPNPALSALLSGTEQGPIVLDANFFLPPDWTRPPYSFRDFRSLWLDPLFSILPNPAIHEAVLEELLPDTEPRLYVEERLAVPPVLLLLRDASLSPMEEAVRNIKEELISPTTQYIPSVDNKSDRGEVKTLAHMAAKGYTLFLSNDRHALRLIEQAELYRTSLDDLLPLRFYEALFLLLRLNGANHAGDVRQLYRTFYSTARGDRGNPSWSEFCSAMEELYPV